MDKLSKEIMVGEVNGLDTGHGRECKSESGAMTNPGPLRDETYGVQLKPKAGQTSVWRRKGSEQDSKSRGSVMSIVKHY